ncbi:hypothetical protein ACFLXT_05110 [Chloroflexota bacterium]
MNIENSNPRQFGTSMERIFKGLATISVLFLFIMGVAETLVAFIGWWVWSWEPIGWQFGVALHALGVAQILIAIIIANLRHALG